MSLLFLFFFLASSCGENPEGTEQETILPEESVNTTVAEERETAPDEDETEHIWALYSGKLGDYDQHMIMELVITGTEVSGSYFYTKHQKSLSLNGTYDPSTSKVKVTESYKGKNTGYIEFDLMNGELSGHWMKKAGATETQPFKAKLTGLDEADFNPVHSTYENPHQISMYNGDSDEIEEVKDVLKISRIGGKYFSFYYSVIGSNAHLGNIEGLAEIDENGTGIFRDEYDCVLEFILSEKNVEISETGDCQPYRGYRAYFGGTLKKVK